jgi:hypothetical protein
MDPELCRELRRRPLRAISRNAVGYFRILVDLLLPSDLQLLSLQSVVIADCLINTASRLRGCQTPVIIPKGRLMNCRAVVVEYWVRSSNLLTSLEEAARYNHPWLVSFRSCIIDL